MNRWGKAGVRLTDQQAEHRNRQAVATRNRRNLTTTADNRVAYRLWRAGEVKPYLITHALNARALYGPEVDRACGAQEPDVDLWEAGKLYPTWAQLLALATLTGKTPRFFCAHHEHMAADHTSLRFHVRTGTESPPMWSYDMSVVHATVNGTPIEIPVADEGARA